MHRLLRAACAASLVATTLTTHAGEVHVAVAANFAVPMSHIAARFTAATGHTLKLSAGATGKFYSQIVAGAPFEVLVAADDQTPKKLISAGHAVSGSNFTYAIGKLVLWSRQPGLVDNQGAVLDFGKFRHLAIANPKVAPYGAAALQVLKARGLLDAVAPKLVTGESIAQAFQFVSTGNAELGFVALSQVISANLPKGDARPPEAKTATPPAGPVPAPVQPLVGSYWLVPANLYSEIRQDAVLLKVGEKNPAAAALLAYMKSAAAKEVMQSFGYGP